jgi:hypothetical protein
MGPKQIAAGRTEPGKTNWQAFSSNGLFLDVDTSSAGFTECPIYVTSLAGNAALVHMEGMTSLYPPGAPAGSPGGPPLPGPTGPTARGFRVYINFTQNVGPLTPEIANDNRLHINWIGVEN